MRHMSKSEYEAKRQKWVAEVETEEFAVKAMRKAAEKAASDKSEEAYLEALANEEAMYAKDKEAYVAKAKADVSA